MTQQEIKELVERVDDSYGVDVLCSSLHGSLLDALNRLAILEAAVAWHGFDEVPEMVQGFFSVEIELKTITPLTVRGAYRNSFYSSGAMSDPLHIFKSSEARELGFTGWRYPVGDLSE